MKDQKSLIWKTEEKQPLGKGSSPQAAPCALPALLENADRADHQLLYPSLKKKIWPKTYDSKCRQHLPFLQDFSCGLLNFIYKIVTTQMQMILNIYEACIVLKQNKEDNATKKLTFQSLLQDHTSLFGRCPVLSVLV